MYTLGSVTEGRKAPTFYMASYMFDVMCARNVFASMNLKWHAAELQVHVYLNILWENM